MQNKYEIIEFMLLIKGYEADLVVIFTDKITILKL